MLAIRHLHYRAKLVEEVAKRADPYRILVLPPTLKADDFHAAADGFARPGPIIKLLEDPLVYLEKHDRVVVPCVIRWPRVREVAGIELPNLGILYDMPKNFVRRAAVADAAAENRNTFLRVSSSSLQTSVTIRFAVNAILNKARVSNPP